MRFKEWVQIDEARFKGLKRQFQQQYPHMPQYVRNDLYNNRISWNMQKAVSQQPNRLAPTEPYDPLAPTQSNTAKTSQPSPNSSGQNSPSKIMGQQGLDNIRWVDAPRVINVSPLDFDQQTLNIMLKRRFGFEPSPGIWNDENRMRTQHSLMNQRGAAENEPIIVVYNGDLRKFRLLEGWHRTMNYLLFDGDSSKGAPPDQIEILKSGNLQGLDFNRWTKVPIKAYIGFEASNTPQPIHTAA